MAKSIMQSDVRMMNRRLVFDLFRRRGTLTRADISAATGMSAPSAQKVTQDLLAGGIIREQGELSTALGRKPMAYRFNRDAISAFGVEFEGQRLSMGLTRIDGEVVYHTGKSIAPRFDDRLADAMIDCWQRVMRHAGGAGRIAGIGMGIPGVVDRQARRIEFAPLIGVEKPLDTTPVLHRIAQATGLPVLIENDVNCAAMGEWRERGGPPGDLIYLSLGTGLGAGVILDGALRRGGRNLCGEFGYTLGAGAAGADRAQSGWLERRLNLDGLVARYNWRPGDAPPGGMAAEVAAELAPYLANILTFLDVDTVALGGVLTDALGRPFAEALSAMVNGMTVSGAQISAHRSRQPGIAGAAALAIEHWMDALL
ncbi:MAG: ROK family protein [Clostridiales bacterium]|nr:ROK family protein [Clostridiales bacterium]